MDPDEGKIQATFVTEFICTCKQKDYVSLLMAAASNVHVRVLISQKTRPLSKVTEIYTPKNDPLHIIQ